MPLAAAVDAAPAAAPWQHLRQIVALCPDGAPKPGSGATRVRFGALADWSGQDLSLGRLAEGHMDALAILDEAAMEPVAGAVYGVWTARPSMGGTRAFLGPEGWQLEGDKPFCSGSTYLDRALVTAEADDGYRLFDVSVTDHVVHVHPQSWPSVGMADSLSETLRFGGPPVPGTGAISGPGFYLERPGFWAGAVGVAACWFGGARALLDRVTSVSTHPSDLVAAELGYAVAHVDLMRRVLEHAADEIDADPRDAKGEARRRALVVRHAVHHAALQVLGHVAAATGARPLCHDAEQGRRAADLYVYLAQYHGPQDARALGLTECDEKCR